jgi:hypothetical protein
MSPDGRSQGPSPKLVSRVVKGPMRFSGWADCRRTLEQRLGICCSPVRGGEFEIEVRNLLLGLLVGFQAVYKVIGGKLKCFWEL